MLDMAGCRIAAFEVRPRYVMGPNRDKHPPLQREATLRRTMTSSTKSAVIKTMVTARSCLRDARTLTPAGRTVVRRRTRPGEPRCRLLRHLFQGKRLRGLGEARGSRPGYISSVSEWLLGRPDDTRDALLEAALAEVPQALASWQRLVSRGIQPRQDGVTARWLPLVAHNIGAAVTDTSSREILKLATQEGWAHGVTLLSAAAPAISALRAAGIDAVLLKGAALACAVYPHPGVRPFGDVDLLVRPRDFAQATSLLTSLGWVPEPMHGGPDNEGQHAITFTAAQGGHVIDLHRFVLVYTDSPEVDEGLWSRIEPVESNGVHAHVLCPADQLLHTCVHGVRWSPVHAATWVADATWIIRQAADRLNWDVLIAETRARRLSFQVAEALTLVARLGRAPIPAEVMERLDVPVTLVERLECRAGTLPRHGVMKWVTYVLSWRRVFSSLRSEQRGFVAYLAIKTGIRSPRHLFGWVTRVTDRWVRESRTARPPDGRSRGPTFR
jgi:hypothetical protein